MIHCFNMGKFSSTEFSEKLESATLKSSFKSIKYIQNVKHGSYFKVSAVQALSVILIQSQKAVKLKTVNQQNLCLYLLSFQSNP